MSERDRSIDVPLTLIEKVWLRIADPEELRLVVAVSVLAALEDSESVSFPRLAASPLARRALMHVSPEPFERRLQATLDRAVANGSLLRISVRRDDESEARFLPATEENRRKIQALRDGSAAAAIALGLPAESDVALFRPNIFTLYESVIGPLTPLLADQLRDAERLYPRRWLEEAIAEAAAHNRRSWRYIESILQHWEETGGPEKRAARTT